MFRSRFNRILSGIVFEINSSTFWGRGRERERGGICQNCSFNLSESFKYELIDHSWIHVKFKSTSLFKRPVGPNTATCPVGPWDEVRYVVSRSLPSHVKSPEHFQPNFGIYESKLHTQTHTNQTNLPISRLDESSWSRFGHNCFFTFTKNLISQTYLLTKNRQLTAEVDLTSLNMICQLMISSPNPSSKLFFSCLSDYPERKTNEQSNDPAKLEQVFLFLRLVFFFCAWMKCFPSVFPSSSSSSFGPRQLWTDRPTLLRSISGRCLLYDKRE